MYVRFVGYNKLSKIPTMSLNTRDNKYHCVRCGAGGYSVGLYARVRNINTGDAFKELINKECFSMDREKVEISPINLIADIEYRDKVYSYFLNMLKLERSHREMLKNLGFLDSSIDVGMYRSVPKNYLKRRIICAELARNFKLDGVPGFCATCL